MHDSSSSDPTAVSIRCEAALELGRKLTKELEFDESVDTLGRWMAHYIGELIQDAEQAAGEERLAKLRVCSEAILRLWRHRYELPDGRRPFQNLEPILRALKSLDPDDGTPRYFRGERAAIGKTDKENGVGFWLQVIDGLDYSAKALIRFCLMQAADGAINKSEEWVALAQAAGADLEIELPIIRVIHEETDLLKKLGKNEAVRKQLEGRIDRLEGFVKMADALLSELKQRVRELPQGTPNKS